VSNGVAVVLIFHDRLEYLSDALRSVRTQLGGGPTELVVVGPVDPGAGLLRDGERFVRSTFAGIGGKFADGVRATEAPLVAFLEDDDRFLPERLETIRARFAAEPRLGYLQTAVTAIDPSGAPSDTPFPHQADVARWRRRGTFELPARPGARELRRLVGIPPGFNNSSIALRRSVLTPVLGDLEAADLHVDLFLLYAALASGSILRFEPAALTELRVHPGSVSDPRGLDGDEAMDRLREFLERTEPGRLAMAEFAHRAGPPAVARAAEGQVAVEHLIHRLRSRGASRSAVARAFLQSLARLDTFEVRNRRAALGLGALGAIAPRGARAVYLAELRRGDRSRPRAG
jgi:hypothetical protein